jgi:hypothetical protein
MSDGSPVEGWMARSDQQAVHRTMVLVDVEGFGALTRTLPYQQRTRAELYAMLRRALAEAGVAWDDCYPEDRGDGVLLLVPPEYPKRPLVEVLPEALARELHGHNRTSHANQQFRLRLAVHAGEVAFDDHGVTSTSLTTAFRLLNATPVKKALADSQGVLAFVVSRWVFDEVVRHSAVLDPATFRPVSVRGKEVHDVAWVALPDRPYPADYTVLESAVPRTAVPQPERSTPPVATGDAASSDQVREDHVDTGTSPERLDRVPMRGVSIAGGVHGSGPGITIGAVTGGNLTLSSSPASDDGPPDPL